MAKASGFKLYDVTVLLGGSRNNEIRKNGVTAPEVMLLSTIHGGADSLRDMVSTKGQRKTLDHSDQAERARLIAIYEGTEPSKRGFIQRVFGPSTIPLPRTVSRDALPEEQVPMQTVSAEIADSVEPHAALIG